MPGRDGPENLRILKKSQLRLDHGGRQLSFCHWGESWGFGHWVEKLRFSDLYRQILDITRCTARWWGSDSMVSIVRIVSLLVSNNQRQEVNKPFVPEQESACFRLCMAPVFEYVFVVPLLLISPNYATLLCSLTLLILSFHSWEVFKHQLRYFTGVWVIASFHNISTFADYNIAVGWMILIFPYL